MQVHVSPKSRIENSSGALRLVCTIQTESMTNIYNFIKSVNEKQMRCNRECWGRTVSMAEVRNQEPSVQKFTIIAKMFDQI